MLVLFWDKLLYFGGKCADGKLCGLSLPRDKTIWTLLLVEGLHLRVRSELLGSTHLCLCVW